MNVNGRFRRLCIEEQGGVAVPRLFPLLGMAGIVFVIGFFWNPASPACVAGIGVLVTVAAARESRFLLRVALLAFGVRALLATVFHWAATLDLSILRPLQTAPAGDYRFWIASLDSAWYHASALEIVAAWQQGTELPGGSESEYRIFTAATYLLFGRNPLNVVLWNSLFGALMVVAGYRIAVRLAGASTARPAAVLIGLWPSAVFWSTQLLKDAASLWLILLMLHLTMCAVEPLPTATRWRALARWAGLLFVLFIAALLTHRIRHYVLPALMTAPPVFVAYALVRRTRETPWRIFAACAVLGVMVLAVSTSRRIDFAGIFVPPYPEIGYTNLGVMYQTQGNLDTAQTYYERALAIVREYPPALKRLGTIAIARNDRAKAIAYFERYLVHEPGDTEVRSALAALRPVEVAALQGQPIQSPEVARRAPAAPEITESVPRPMSPTGPPPVTRPAPEVARRAPAAPEITERVPRPESPTEQPPVTPPAPPEIVRRLSPSLEVTKKVPPPVQPGQFEVKPLPALIATPVPVPPKSFAITGPGSDTVTGKRAWTSGDVLAMLMSARAGFTRTGGHTMLDPDVQFRDYWDVLRYLPRAIANVLLTPYPWQWFDLGGSTGAFKALSALEALLLYASIIPLLVGLGTMVRRGSPDALYLAVFVVGMTALLGLVVSNLGTLFRLRLESLLPLFTVAGVGWTWLLHRRGRRA